ncbi:PspC domain-containing protein [Saccharothrix longispora]|uniref:Phage shock protein PspC (Stress-responsive transcriptional regulator) n=1 Tax=Saccharothrix longispora TaxID=33920 RepID=A0ABU1Q4M1_9PSEU|nr:PspC domain-containing protein [Saccharothrix longispora]MDR6597827.1 phage shock protein PspC (stress-responsive transcriptional regulator) [Saccharothrix longispora]
MTTNTVLNQATDTLNQATDKVKKLRRSRDDRMVAGVCGGLAKLLGVDAALLRILLVAGTLFGFGTGAILYLAAWVLVPEEA